MNAVNMKKPSALKYLFLAILVQLVWGLTPSASRIILNFLPVETYSAFRYSVSGLIFLGYSLIANRGLTIRLRDFPAIAIIGILAYSVSSLGTLYGLKLGGVLNFALASSLNAIITAVVAIIVLKEHLSRFIVVAGVLSIAGGLLLASGKYDISDFNIAAGSLGLICGAYVLEALGFVFSRRFKERMPLTEYLAVAQLSAGIFMWVVSISMGHSPDVIMEMPAEGLASLVFVCLISCCICYFLLYWLLNFIDGSKLAFFDCFHTFSAAVFGALLFAEPFNAKMLVGGVVLAAAVLVVSWPQMRRGKTL